MIEMENNNSLREFKVKWVSEAGNQEAVIIATTHNEAKRKCSFTHPSFVLHRGGYTVKLILHRKCLECGKDIHDAGRAKVCKGKWVDGIFIKSACYLEKWRRSKRIDNQSPVFTLKKKRVKLSKIRPCLKCRRNFKSLHTYNRVCPYCDNENARESRAAHKLIIGHTDSRSAKF